MRTTRTGVLLRALAAARPPKPPPTITTRGKPSLMSCSELKQPDEQSVALLGEGLERTAGHLLRNSIDDLLLEFRPRDIRGAEIGPPSRHRARELLEEMPHTAGTASQVVQQVRSEEPTSELQSPDHIVCHLRHANNSVRPGHRVRLTGALL